MTSWNIRLEGKCSNSRHNGNSSSYVEIGSSSSNSKNSFIGNNNINSGKISRSRSSDNSSSSDNGSGSNSKRAIDRSTVRIAVIVTKLTAVATLIEVVT